MLKLKQTDFLNYSFFRLPEKIGGNLPGVHYIRDVADADALVSSLVSLTVLLSHILASIGAFYVATCK